jgi:hypothetical protein
MDTEQQFILRVQDPDLAGRLRGWLRDKENIEEIRLLFESREPVLGCCSAQHVGQGAKAAAQAVVAPCSAARGHATVLLDCCAYQYVAGPVATVVQPTVVCRLLLLRRSTLPCKPCWAAAQC